MSPGASPHRVLQLGQTLVRHPRLQVGPPQRGARPPILGIELDGAKRRLQRLLVPARPQEGGRDVRPVRQRVELLRAPHQRQRLVVPLQRAAEPAVVIVDVGGARAQLERQLELRLGASPVEVVHHPEKAQHRMRLAQLGVERQCRRDGLHALVVRLVRPHRAAARPGRQLGEGQGERRREPWRTRGRPRSPALK